MLLNFAMIEAREIPYSHILGQFGTTTSSPSAKTHFASPPILTLSQSRIMPSPYQVLSEADVEQFMQHGLVHLKGCFTQEKSTEWMGDMWKRLGLEPDAARWPIERCNMASHRGIDVREFSPKVWGAMCDLLGGAGRVNHNGSTWTDGMIVNLGDVEGRPSRSSRENSQAGTLMATSSPTFSTVPSRGGSLSRSSPTSRRIRDRRLVRWMLSVRSLATWCVVSVSFPSNLSSTTRRSVSLYSH